MIRKERLLSGLNEIVYVEEGMVTLFANFSRELLKHVDEIEDPKKQKIGKMLSRLNRDSWRHKEILDNMIRDIDKSGKNEY